MVSPFRPLLSLAVFSLVSLAAHADELKIVAAENFYGAIARQIAGNDANITSILSNPNQDPHEFTTNASTAKAVADADVIIYNGIGYDSWMDKLLGAQGKPGRLIICVASLIGAKDGDNPHIWYAPHTMQKLVDKLTAILAERDSPHEGAYQNRRADFIKSTQDLDARIVYLKTTYPGTVVTSTEPVFGYMSDALGFKMLNYDFQVSVMNDTEPSVSQTAAFEKSLRDKSVKLLFYNKQVVNPTTERLKKIAVAYGVPIVGVTEMQPDDCKSYAEWMLLELKTVQASLEPKIIRERPQ